MTTTDVPDFPVDDATLLAVEHALGAAYDIDSEGNRRIVGADYTLTMLLDFIGGTTGMDPDAEVIQDGRDESDLPEWERGRHWDAAPIIYDTRPHYTERGVIAALIAEVRRLRATTTEVGDPSHE
jgi:hypothetical protein